ncbi:DUF6310 domain-containing protein [Myxococcus sp. CA040A]|uniref:DUF6310 domain-containing protein n=1 Tax=Myxococcus sp. CA040A TaxID=2741738 RepID=UPI00157A245A|nr:DUF6310 domain-containing protein [Myxococcus sp. CA040A]NTX08567.1 hypothetical protein [Myxococcus sp. CA040A]
MRLHACAALLIFLSACATPAPPPRGRTSRSPRLANLQRAAGLPWMDGGRCAVREASQPWPVLAERCYPAINHDRIRFNDPTGRCAVASAGTVVLGVGLCVLAAPEIIVGAVIVVGAVVVGLAIKEALDAYELRGSSPEEAEPASRTKAAPRDLSANRNPQPEPSGQDWFPPVPTEPLERERLHRCKAIPVKHRGGDDAHDRCADRIPPNRYPGMDVLVDTKHFDALQVGVRVLWEIKTDRFDTYSDFLKEQVVEDQVEELREEHAVAVSCGYGFVVGVSTKEHKEALEFQARELKIVVTECKR